MDTERWQRVEEIFAASLELTAGRRAAFLAAACEGDEELRREVESLLAHHRQDGFLVTGGATAVVPVADPDAVDPLIGSRLGRFEVLARLGAGGMGEVYLAQDPKLARRVALKLLPARLSDHPETLRRFRREALAASALNHPNIVTVFEIVEAGGREVLVSELVEGETLRARLLRGPLPLAQALDLAAQVARGLQAAHRAGIVHRDVKPENLMIRTDGLVKLLDFGIAKSEAGEAGRDLSQSPTHVLTGTGVILGTASYMSPEQARGEPAGRPADVWALGCVLYEALTGRQAFPGRTAPDVLAAILTQEPAWDALPADTPWLVRNLLRRCLEKDPEGRWQSAGDVAETLRWALDPGSSGVVTAGVTAGAGAPRSTGRRWERRAWATALLVAVGLGALAVSRWQVGERRSETLQVELPVPTGGTKSEWFQLSPDGRRVAWIGWSSEGQSALWVRRLAEREGRRLPGTTGAVQPFWSPDGRWIAFFADGKLKKVPAAGGPPTELASAPSPYGGAWSRRGAIVFAPRVNDRVYRVGAEGGAISGVTALAAGEDAHRWPCFLPDGERFVFLADSARTENHQIRLGSLAGGDATPLVQAVSQPICADEHILYVQSGSLLAQRLDPAARRLVGEPAVVVENVDANYVNHHFEVTLAPGLLAYRTTDPLMRFVWLDRRGQVQGTVGEPGRYGGFDLSRDGRRLAYARHDADWRSEGVWWRDLERGLDARVEGADRMGTAAYPVWSGDGEQLALALAATGSSTIAVVRADDSTPGRELPGPVADMVPSSWSADGRWLAVVRTDPGDENRDVWLVSPVAGEAVQVTDAAGNEQHPAFSPDGRFLAFAADPTGRREVYLQRVPAGGPAIRVSRGGGNLPAWRRDGGEIYFVSAEYELVAVPMAWSEDGVVAGEPERLFALQDAERSLVWWEGVAPSPDGSRFLALQHVAEPTGQPLRLIVGWRLP